MKVILVLVNKLAGLEFSIETYRSHLEVRFGTFEFRQDVKLHHGLNGISHLGVKTD
jgi:hypothetical protein